MTMQRTSLRPLSDDPDACPIGCGRERGRGKLLCWTCWSAVPPRLQATVNRTWRAWLNDMGNAEKKKQYRAAADDTIASV